MEDLDSSDLEKLVKKIEAGIKYVNKATLTSMGYSAKERINDLLQAYQILLIAKRDAKKIPLFHRTKDYEEYINCRSWLVKGIIEQLKAEINYEKGT